MRKVRGDSEWTCQQATSRTPLPHWEALTYGGSEWATLLHAVSFLHQMLSRGRDPLRAKVSLTLSHVAGTEWKSEHLRGLRNWWRGLENNSLLTTERSVQSTGGIFRAVSLVQSLLQVTSLQALIHSLKQTPKPTAVLQQWLKVYVQLCNQAELN